MHDQEDIVRTLVIPDERPASLNDFMERRHWTWRNNEVTRVHQLVRGFLDPNTPMFDCRVDILMIVYFDDDPLDSSNIPLKLYEDGLKTWWIEDDTTEFVRRTATESRIDKENPRVEITLTPVLEE